MDCFATHMGPFGEAIDKCIAYAIVWRIEYAWVSNTALAIRSRRPPKNHYELEILCNAETKRVIQKQAVTMNDDFEASDGSLFVVVSDFKFLLNIFVEGCKNYPEEFTPPQYSFPGLGTCQLLIFNRHCPNEFGVPIIRMSIQLKERLECNTQSYNNDILDDIAVCICHADNYDHVDKMKILTEVMKLMEGGLLQRIDNERGWNGFNRLLTSSVHICSPEWEKAKTFFSQGKNVPSIFKGIMM